MKFLLLSLLFLIVFSSNKNIETISELITELKHYFDLKSECVQIDIVSKMTRLLTALVVGAILFLLLGLAVMFLSMMLAAALAPFVGGEACAYAIIVCSYIVICWIIYHKRSAWIEAPIAHFLGTLFLEKSNHNDKEPID